MDLPPKGELKAHYRLDRSVYLVAEPIFLTVWLENIGTRIECYRTQEMWDLVIKDEDGQEYKFRGRQWEVSQPPLESSADSLKPCHGDFSELKPGQKSGASNRPLLDYYGEGQAVDHYLRPATYTITARCFKSDAITFSVVAPSTTDDSAAAAAMIQAIENASTELTPAEKRFQFFSDFVQRFPNSVYTPRALRSLLATSTAETPLYDAEKKQYFARYMITHFPESGFAYYALMDIDISAVGAGEKTEVAAGLRRLKAHIGAEDLRKRADELIRQLEK
jgi:hypothetical protein